MTPRQTGGWLVGNRPMWAVGLAVAVAVATGAVRLADSGEVGGAFRSALAGLVGAAVVLLGVTLVPRRGLRGLLVGALFVGAGLLSWTVTDRPALVWGLLAVEVAVFAVWSWPWLRGLRPAARLGTAWLGVSYWLLGVVGALLVAHWGIAAQRLAYAGVFGLAVLAVLARSRFRDLSGGIVAAFVVALGLLLIAGSGNLFENVHAVPPNGWGVGVAYRFWGGPWLLYQPNSMAALAAIAAVRIGLDQAYAIWQRVAVTALAGFIVYCTNSRTGFLLILGVAAVAHAALLWWRARGARSAEVPRGTVDLPDYGGRRATRIAAAVPFLVLLAVAGATYLPKLVPSHHHGSGGTTTVQDPYLSQERYAEGGVTSGRLDTWRVVWADWRKAPLAEKVFGDATTTRAVVKRASSGNDIQLTTDNAAVGAFRHAGVAGLLAFALGLVLLVRHALRRDVPAWFLVAVLASLPPIATSDALLGGTGGTVWVLLLAGEARLLFARGARREAAPGVHPVDTGRPAVASPGGQRASLPSGTVPSISEPTIPEISVVIPTRGRPELVTRAVSSALGQTFRDVEVLVVVDGPDEPTHAALAEVDDPRLRVVGLAESGGAPNARNTGVRAARGRWVAFLDDDDEWLPEKLSVQHDLALNSAAAQPIVISCLTLRTPRAEFTLPRRLPDEGEPLSEWFSVRRGLFHGDGFIQTSTILAPTELLLKVPFTVGLRRMQELDWGLRALAETGTELLIAPQPLVIFNADENRPRISLESPWREMLEWLRRSRGLVTPRAYAALAMSQVSSMAATTHSPRVAWTLLREAHRHGRPHPMEYLTFAQIWLVPGDLRRRVRDLFSGRHGERPVAAPRAAETVGGAG